MIELDGKEGGGQILRTALALSLYTGKGFIMKDIRLHRTPKGGLQPQHLKCIEAAASMCSNAIVEGAAKDSYTLRFVPGKFEPKSCVLDIGTAGSVSLLLQSLLPALVVGKKRISVEVKGGTTGKWAMPVAFLEHVLLPQLWKYCDVKYELIKRGYYPKGGGSIKLTVKPKFSAETISSAPKFELMDQGKLLQVKGISHASSLLADKKVADRQAESALLGLKKLGCPVNIEKEYGDTLCAGSGIVLWAICSIGEGINMQQPIRLGSDCLGERGKPSEDIGFEAAANLIKSIESKAPVDKWLADNLIPYLGIFGGRIRVEEITDHIRANIYACEAFIGKKYSINDEDRIISLV